MPCPKRLRDEQDPDYPDEPAVEGKRQRIAIQAARADACDRVRRVVQQHFGDELRRREESLMECQSRLHEATQALHLLRYLAVSAYYSTKTTTQQQARLHPAVKKLVGKQGAEHTVLHLNVPDVNQLRLRNISLPSTSRSTHSSSASTSSQSKDVRAPIKQPRYVAPKEKESPCLVSPSRASARKVKKRLLVGNISKWLGEELREGAATHKWMMYVRGPPDNPDISNLVERVRFYLHSSYQPHDVIEVKSPPFHLSRRGWGEFPVRLQIHFHNSENKPLDVIHQLRLDRTYTGLQTLGAETLVDAWLFEGSQAKEPTATVTSSSIEPQIKQEAAGSCSAISSVNYEAAESSNKVVTPRAQTPPQKATRSLLKQFNTSTSPALSASSVVKECFKKEPSVNDVSDNQLNQNHVNVLNTSPVNTTIQTENIIKIMSPNQGSLARFLCGQINTSCIKVETINSCSNITVSQAQPTTSEPSSEVLNHDMQVKFDNARILQHHDYAKPAAEAETSIQNTKNIQVVSGTSLLKSNIKNCSDLSLLSGKKIIQLKPVTSSNQLKPIPVSPKQTNHVIINQNKSIQVLNSASILKNLPSNGVSKLVNGTKLLLSKGVENSQRVILVKMDRNGKLQQIPQQSTHDLPPLPPLVMIKKPLGSSQISTSQIRQLNPALIKSLQTVPNTMQSIKIEPELVSESPTALNVKPIAFNPMTQGKKTYPHSLLINNQAFVANKCTGNITINGKQIFTVATSSGMNVLVRGQDPEIEKFDRLVLSYEQQLKQLECRSVDDADLALSLLLRQLPLIGIKDDAYCQVHPYIVPCAEIFFSWHIGKQRAFEAMRAKLVGRLLIAQGFPARKLWDIVRWARHHGYSPLPCEPIVLNPQVEIKQEVTDFEPEEYPAEDVMKPSYTYSEPNAVLGWLESHVVDRSKFEDEVVDVESVTENNTKSSGQIESPANEDFSHIGAECMAVRNVASELGINLNDQSATMMMEVGKLFMEDLVRRALAEACSKTKGTPSSIELNDVKTALLNRPEFDIFSNQGLGMEPDPSFSQAYKS